MLSNDTLLTLDPKDGRILSQAKITPFILNMGLIYDGGSLYFVDQNIHLWRDRFYRLHPATGETFEVGKTGFTFGFAFASMSLNPLTHRLFASFANGLFTIDQNTGKASYLSRMPYLSAITCIAISAGGRVLGAESSFTGQPYPRLYEVDVFTGDLRLLGEVPIGGGGEFDSLAFDSADRLWGYFGFSTIPSLNGFYIIDLDTLQATKPFEFPYAAQGGFTFGPTPEVEEYCTGKRNSLGCIPSIGWKGLPSASASKGFEVFCRNVRVNEPGLLFLSTSGRAAKPFLGGLLCLEPPILRTPAISAGGPPPPPWTCDGHWEVDVNAFLHDNGPLTAGAVLQAQWWGRDAGFVPPADNQLSDALEITLMP